MAGVTKTKSRDGKYPDEWSGWYTDRNGERVSFTGTTHRSDTLKVARLKEMEELKIRMGLSAPPVSSAQAYDDAVSEYLAWGASQGGRRGGPWGQVHLESRERHLSWFKGQLGLLNLSDLNGSLARVEKALRGLLQKGKAPKTVNNYRESIAAFCDWCVDREYLASDPLKKLRAYERRALSERRALTRKEVASLLKAAPPHRRLVYELALGTGLRRKEIASLTPRNLPAEDHAITLDPAWTKNRRGGTQPVSKGLFDQLQAFCAGKPADEILFPINDHIVRYFDADIRTAGVEKLTAEGKIDFHALRATFGTLLLESGANPKEVQVLMRHSSMEMTTKLYMKVRQRGLLQAVAKLEGIVSSSMGNKAGTARRKKRPHPKVRPDSP